MVFEREMASGMPFGSELIGYFCFEEIGDV
jgi:hypothetical protein